MKASETKLQPILSGPRQYIIPYFQRTYSWKTKQWKGLWEDLQSLYTADKEREHFLGAIVTVPMGMTQNGTGKLLYAHPIGTPQVSLQRALVPNIKKKGVCQKSSRIEQVFRGL